MKKRIHRLIHQVNTGGIVRTLSRARFFRDACERYGMVYFGTVDQTDEQTMVRGLTVSTRAVDRHYCVGSVEGYDAILLERTDQLYFPYKKPESYRWTILQIDLEWSHLPHVFLDAHHHQSVFYDVFSAKYPGMTRQDKHLFADHDSRFSHAFTAHCAIADIPRMLQYLHPEVTATLGHHFPHYDFELFDDKLIVYSSQQVPSKTVIENLVRAGVWLAREIEKIDRPAQPTYDQVEPQTA